MKTHDGNTLSLGYFIRDQLPQKLVTSLLRPLFLYLQEHVAADELLKLPRPESKAHEIDVLAVVLAWCLYLEFHASLLTIYCPLAELVETIGAFSHAVQATNGKVFGANLEEFVTSVGLGWREVVLFKVQIPTVLARLLETVATVAFYTCTTFGEANIRASLLFFLDFAAIFNQKVRITVIR